MTFGSLFAGIGGIDLGLERAGMKCAWQVEIDPYCLRVLEKHWPEVPRHGDVRECGSANLVPVDLICGGFPCQDISFAGNGAGLDGRRSGLWKEFKRIIREMGPRYVFVENVPALLARGLGDVLGDLADIGYDATWSCLSACSLGAPHTRERVFIVAYPNGVGRKVRDFTITGRPLPRDRMAALERTWETPQPDLVRMVDGIPVGLDQARIKACGNAVVPQVAEWIGHMILEADGATPEAS